MTTLLDGFVSDGWGRVADAFEACFKEHNELGGAVSVYVDGECVVDLWGGVADARTGRPWARDTVTPVFSTTKGLTALCAHMLVERGLLDLDEPVATYWPEFAQAGKETLPVRWLLTHQAGLPFVDADLTFEDLEAETPVLAALAAQRPYWTAGSHFAYHAITYGHLVGEVVRRVSGQHLRDFLTSELVEPLGLSAWLGLPIHQEVDLAHLQRVSHDSDSLPQAVLDARQTLERAISLGHAVPAELLGGPGPDFNDRRLLAIPLGGSTLVSDARSVARTYAATVSEVDGVRLLQDDSVRRAAGRQTAGIPYFGWPEEYAQFCPFDFALGFAPLSHLDTTTFGHGGAGGSVGWGNLEARVGFGYVMNRMEATNPDERSTILATAVRDCLGAR